MNTYNATGILQHIDDLNKSVTTGYNEHQQKAMVWTNQVTNIEVYSNKVSIAYQHLLNGQVDSHVRTEVKPTASMKRFFKTLETNRFLVNDFIDALHIEARKQIIDALLKDLK